jgi:hypothetical protein
MPPSATGPSPGRDETRVMLLSEDRVPWMTGASRGLFTDVDVDAVRGAFARRDPRLLQPPASPVRPTGEQQPPPHLPGSSRILPSRQSECRVTCHDSANAFNGLGLPSGPILPRLRQLRRLEGVAAGQVRNCPRQLQNAVVGASAHMQLLHRRPCPPNYSFSRNSCGQQRLAHRRQRKFLQVEFRGFLKIGNRFFNGVSLTHSTDLGAFCYVQILFLVKNSRKGDYRHRKTYLS